ncbi:serine hydrolase domain-containing protein [Winogradskyella sp.]|uniref:serine hydrolase domain-containing protein n=1 Tax=Winogradskyella sp. TaxID=1883156 RepID=UPI001B0F87D9|nr:serine hydrolase domain-containing protein [Winogradskyella sp.]MBO6881040.1 beta-lactamase family protein [Winogradskyella sp.]
MKSFLTLISLIIVFIGKAQTSMSDEKSIEIDNYIDYIMKEQKIPGLALAITHKGKVLKKKTYGLASIEYNVAVTDSSSFWLASVSKHFTATAIMQLYEKGILDLDDEIHKHLPDAPNNWRGVTIRHLLTHTSGLPISRNASAWSNRSAKGTYTAKQIYENSKKDTLVFKPGEDFRYSDEGTYLLGYIVHKISGLSFNDYMQKMIFEPSGMSSAYMMDHFKIHPNQVTGYSLKNGEIIPDRNSYRLIDTELNAAGGIYATIDDMIHWEYAMTNNLLLTQKSKDLMWSSHKLNNGYPTHYGFCWNTQMIQGKRIIYHPGVAGTEYLRFVDDSLSIIILTNQAKYERAISQKVAEIIGVSPHIKGEDIRSEHVSIKKPKNKALELLIGEFEFVPNENYYLDDIIKMDIVLKENELWIEYPAKKEYRKQHKLAKLDNGRWIQLSWEPTYVETSFELLQNNKNISFKVYEDYGLGYDIHVGELKKVN